MNAPDLRNLPPHSLEAEHGLLGAILTHGGPVLDRIEGTVSAGDFYRADHRQIFAAAKALHDAGTAASALLIAQFFGNRGGQGLGGFGHRRRQARLLQQHRHHFGFRAAVSRSNGCAQD